MRQTLSRGVFAAAATATGILTLYGTPALADSFAGGGAEDSHGALAGNNVQVPVHVPVNACGNTVSVAGAFNEASDATCVNKDSGDKHGHGAHAVGGTKGSPGLGSGNTVQVPIHAPVNACGNTVGGLAVANSAHDNTCANLSDHRADHSSGHHSDKSADHSAGSSSHSKSTSGTSHTGSRDGAHATGAAKHSPGLLSGNLIQAPIHLPLNACGNTVSLVGLLNDANDNTCVNKTAHENDHRDKDKDKEKDKEKDKDKERDKERDKETPKPHTKVKTPPRPAEDEHGYPPHMAETGSDGLMAASAAGAVLITGGAMLYRRGRFARR
ncbi:chaplin [Streptomyces sp. NPDC047860]|uniref:chaplin n=1 Tax=Streptomyces sp. NPDC047860 TaxID=3155743 RepID=UPI0033DD1E6C